MFQIKIGMGVLAAIMIVTTIAAEVAVQLVAKTTIIDKIWAFEVAVLSLMGIHRANGGTK